MTVVTIICASKSCTGSAGIDNVALKKITLLGMACLRPIKQLYLIPVANNSKLEKLTLQLQRKRILIRRTFQNKFHKQLCPVN